MKWLHVSYLFTLGLTFGDTGNLLGQQTQFTQIDYQFADGTKADSTQAWGVNPRGDIIGFYVNAGIAHGFLLTGGNYLSIDYPGADSTLANAISATGEIVGSYTVGCPIHCVTHGFLLSGGNYKPIDVSGAMSSEVLGISDNGDLVGDYSLISATPCCGAAQGTQGFLLSGGKFAPVDVGAFPTYASGINPEGRIVGSYNDGNARAFLLDGGNYSLLKYPDATTTFMNALGINARGEIVGRYVNAAGRHGYVMTDRGFTTVDIPGAAFTGVTAINSEGDIVGRYMTSGVFHGFLLSRHEVGR